MSATTIHTLATAHIPELDIDVLVTVWDDGTGEVAYRERRWNTWSAPIALDVAPGGPKHRGKANECAVPCGWCDNYKPRHRRDVEAVSA